MVTQRVKPIRSNEMLVKPNGGSPNAVEDTEVQDEKETVPLGFAVNTRNYQALIDNLACKASLSCKSVSSGCRRQTLAKSTMYQQNQPLQSCIVDEKMAAADQDEEDSCTVVGLPVNTRNYETIVGDNRLIRSDPGTLYWLNRRATVATMAQPIQKDEEVPVAVDEADEEEDDNAVMGLPINTRNYVAYLAGEPGSKVHHAGHRNRGYSNLANEKEVRESRVSDPYLSSSHRGHLSSDPHAAFNRKNQKDTCPSYFENRRTSNAAVVPHAGWVCIQHGAFRSWKRYYAVLSGTEFKYSKGVGQTPKGYGLLMSVKEVEDLRYGLQLEFGDGSTLQIRCLNDQDNKEWLSSMERAIERNHTLNSRSKTSYRLTACEQHEGHLFKQEKNKAWKRYFFVVRVDGYIECRDGEHGTADRKCSGYIKTVSFADCHANGLAIQLSTDMSMVCYAESYDEQMLWYGAISAAASANGKIVQLITSVKSCYIQTALANHAGWLYKQAGLFKGWKRLYFTLHGIELAYAKDTNSATVLSDKAHTVEEWEGHANGLLIRLKSGRVWKVHAETYETAKRWRSVISSACRHAETFNIKKYLNSRRRKKLRPVFGGWLTEVKKGSRLRRFYVMDGSSLGVANDVDNQLESLGNVVDVGSTRDLACGMVFTLADGNKVKVNCDSLADSRCWYECLKFSLRRRVPVNCCTRVAGMSVVGY
ncbi:unnamed protein product [Peronospora belbahrii]|uniref:PH domain-containing protein n=1 Tax=Peronospora belbahrii TaxID=622444 RepID=A0AAU9L1K9_9STRA|nr:unnamed protein product [Peronospora belbahrii]CAH0521036.1 unnamed protein product [Peronospora belbahrii]